MKFERPSSLLLAARSPLYNILRTEYMSPGRRFKAREGGPWWPYVKMIYDCKGQGPQRKRAQAVGPLAGFSLMQAREIGSGKRRVCRREA
jgi:hypothetical protein